MTRLSEESRAVIVDAVERARREGTREAGVEHLLTAVLAHRDGRSLLAEAESGPGADDLLAEVREGQRRGGLSTVDVDALAEMGVDVRALVDRVEAELGEGALDVTRSRRLPAWRGPSISEEFNAALGAADRQARANNERRLTVAHLLLGLLTQPGLVADTLGRHGITSAMVREALEAAGGAGRSR
jgi:ATP-dependent Clp protease ATP-binding subunit ClpA